MRLVLMLDQLSEFLANVEHEKACKITKVAKRPNMQDEIQNNGSMSLTSLGLKHGDMLYVDASGAGSTTNGTPDLVGSGRKAIDAHGNLVQAERTDDAAYRPGLQSLRAQKLHWTLTDMVEFDSKYTFEIKGEQLSFCSSTSLDGDSCNGFQMYLQRFKFNTCRCAYLYGKFVPGDEIVGSVEYKAKSTAVETQKEKEEAKTKKYGQTKAKMRVADLEEKLKEEVKPKQGAIVHAIYEPLQQNDASSFSLLEDPNEPKVEAIAKGLGLEKVGFIFSHPPRQGYNFSTHELIQSAEQALDATDGKFDSAFAIVKVTSDDGASAAFDAFSLTPQCIEMVAEDALLHMPDNAGHAAINETFLLIVEKKEAHVVDNDFFIKRVPILSHQSPYSGSFPRLNREFDNAPGQQDLKNVLLKVGRNPSDADLAKALSDFNVLVYLGEIFGQDELYDIADFVRSHVENDKPKKIQDGYKLLLFSFAGLD
mmetsp:Transcript_12674/g.20501  ORF Transcript_12674/g.20501 Transcript_12674/m.20501 type:complete len:480 (+) Transcript_12674:93-1532(+)